MKNSKLFLSGFAVVAIVGSAFAFKPFFGSGSLYCTKNSMTGVCTTRVDWRIDPVGGLATNNPCGVDGQGNQLPIYVYEDNTTCDQLPANTKFTATAVQK